MTGVLEVLPLASVTTRFKKVGAGALQISPSAAGRLKYFYTVAPGGLVPAVLQSPDNPMATVQFVNGPGTYLLNLVVTDANGKTSSTPVMLIYKP